MQPTAHPPSGRVRETRRRNGPAIGVFPELDGNGACILGDEPMPKLLGMPDSTPAERLRIALDLFDLGVEMTRARLMREHPDWAPEQVQEGVAAWLRDRPGAELGDCVGRLASPERIQRITG